MASTNTSLAAWQVAEGALLFEVKAITPPEPADDEILVKNHAIAINPIDARLQATPPFPMKYPTVLGEDVAGEVVAVGPNVTRFKKGDRVTGVTAGFDSKRSDEKAFQAHTILRVGLASPIPDSMPYEKAVVLPLGLTTAASALFQEQFLGLRLPTEPAHPLPAKPQTLLVWGGASSVGSCAIQLAVAAGYDVIATASPKNADHVRRLGARAVFDYSSPGVVDELIGAIEGRERVGVFDAVGGAATWAAVVDFVSRTPGPKNVTTAVRGFPDPPEGFTMKQTYSMSIMRSGVGKALWEDFVPKALASGSLVPAPEPHVVGTGLESLQKGINMLREGVSAKKLIVTL